MEFANLHFQKVSNNELQEVIMNATTWELPNLLAHAQSVERIVKLTTEALQILYGQEARRKQNFNKSLGHEMRIIV